MRGYPDHDPIEVAAEALNAAARRYSGSYLQAPFAMATGDDASRLRQAAVAYAESVAPKKRSAPKGRKADE